MLAPGAVASWHYLATLKSDAVQAGRLLNPLMTRGAVNVLHVESKSPSGAALTRNYADADLTRLLMQVQATGSSDVDDKRHGRDDRCDVGHYHPGESTSRSGLVVSADGEDAGDHGHDGRCPPASASVLDATGVDVTVLPPWGKAVMFTPATTPALADVAPGASVDVSVRFVVPAPGQRTPEQSDAAYLAQLSKLDGAVLTAHASATAGGATSDLSAPRPPR